MSRVPRTVRFTNTDRALQLINIMAISRRFHLLWKYLHLRLFSIFPCEEFHCFSLMTPYHTMHVWRLGQCPPQQSRLLCINKTTSCISFSLSFSKASSQPNKALLSYYLILTLYLIQTSIGGSISTTEIKYSLKAFVSEINSRDKAVLSAKLPIGLTCIIM